MRGRFSGLAGFRCFDDELGLFSDSKFHLIGHKMLMSKNHFGDFCLSCFSLLYCPHLGV